MRASRALFRQASQQVEELRQQILEKRDIARSIGVHTHVLSQELCEDSLQLLRLSLPRPRTCDVIDINPGLGVWSRTLHKALEPNRHVLVEKQPKLYSQWLNPLLETPDSKYRYAPDLESALDPENALLSSSFLSNLPGEASPELVHDVSRTLIITATLSARIAASFDRYAVSEGRSFLDGYLKDFYRIDKSMHRYGLVRLLVWVEEAVATAAVPVSVAGRSKLSMRLEAASDVSLVAGPSPYRPTNPGKQRWHQLNEEDYERITSSTRRLSQLPVRRERQQGEIPKPLAFYNPSLDFTLANKTKFPDAAVFIRQLEEMKKVVLAESPDWLVEYKAERQELERKGFGSGRIKDKLPEPPSHLQFRILLNQLRTYYRDHTRITKLIAKHRSMWQKLKYAWQQSHKPNSAPPIISDSPASPAPSSAAQIDSLSQSTIIPEFAPPSRQELYTKLVAETAAFKHLDRITIIKAVDDYRAYDTRPRVLAWNNRPFEPLLATNADFYGRRKKLSLLDVQPRPSFGTTLNTFDRQICFDHVLTMLSTFPADNIRQAARRLLPSDEEAEIMLQTIPELKDPTVGGWHDWSNLRTRSLPINLVMMLALAFERAPDRPTTERLVMMRMTRLNSERRKRLN